MPSRWRFLFIPLLLLGALAWVLVDELRYGADAMSTTATVKSWRSTFLFGYDGVAEVDVDFHGDQLAGRQLTTKWWYRPEPGERIPVVFAWHTSAPARVDSFWHRFWAPLLLVGVSLLWLCGEWRAWRRGRPASSTATASESGKSGSVAGC